VFALAVSSWLSSLQNVLSPSMCFDEVEGLDYMVDWQNILSILQGILY
jgi:hypothetical protein